MGALASRGRSSYAINRRSAPRIAGRGRFTSPHACADAYRLCDHERHEISDAVGVAVEECDPGNSGGASQGERHQQMRAPSIEKSGEEEADEPGDPGRHQAVAAEHPDAPDDLRRGDPGTAKRGILGHEKTAGHEPLADDDPAEDDERQDRGSRVTRDRQDAVDRCAPRITRAPPCPDGCRERNGRDRPGLVSREARERERDADAGRPDPLRNEPFEQQRHGERRQAEEQRLGHRRRLQVQHIRVQREDCRASDSRGTRPRERRRRSRRSIRR